MYSAPAASAMRTFAKMLARKFCFFYPLTLAAGRLNIGLIKGVYCLIMDFSIFRATTEHND